MFSGHPRGDVYLISQCRAVTSSLCDQTECFMDSFGSGMRDIFEHVRMIEHAFLINKFYATQNIGQVQTYNLNNIC